ncbi:MaoC/PaaZ C-terminal domain-containing protein [Burkholderia stabilis]|uniref:MaoC/PaaZ C-terminal domain-containing protein n=1 Tax=Burkholderia stabilis TaxID=95485 RepID=UPI00158A22CC|nr:MaoC/PaaZ C-terminal domain-containing protein [Burkholderia stabilis]
MTLLRYGANEIRAWAMFSGDFNPVHFDLVTAARLGLPDVPVHGMRVMLDVKSALYCDSSATWGAGCKPLLFKATLRAPVLCDTTYRLHIKRGVNRSGFSVVNDNDGKICVNGYLRSATPSEMAGGGASQAIVTGADLRAEATHFATLTDNARSVWLLLDALLFRHLLLHEGALFGDVAHLLGFDDVSSAHCLMARMTVLQTHHTTLIAPLAQRLTIDALFEAIDANRLHFEIDTPATTEDVPGGLAINGLLAAYVGGELLIRTKISLLALPHSPTHQETGA